MIFYYSIWAFISFFSLFASNKPEFRIFFLGTLFFLSLMTGFRFEIGGDWNNYLSIYDLFEELSFADSLLITDPSYGFLNYLSHQFGIVDTIFVNFCCALVFYSCLYFVCKGMKNYWILLLVSFPYLILVVSMGYTRQSVAIALVILAFKYGLNNKYWKLIFLSLFAISFHKSAIVVLMLYPFLIFQGNFFNNKVIFYTYTFFSFLFMSFLIYISSISGENIYTSQDSALSSTGAIFRIVVHFLPLFFYIAHHSKIKKIIENKIYVFDYLSLLIVFSLALAIPYSTLSDRFNLYLIIFDIFVFTSLAESLKSSNKLIMIGSIIFFNSLMLIIWMNFGTWSHAWLPYQNYISNYLLRVI